MEYIETHRRTVKLQLHDGRRFPVAYWILCSNLAVQKAQSGGGGNWSPAQRGRGRDYKMPSMTENNAMWLCRRGGGIQGWSNWGSIGCGREWLSSWFQFFSLDFMCSLQAGLPGWFIPIQNKKTCGSQSSFPSLLTVEGGEGCAQHSLQGSSNRAKQPQKWLLLLHFVLTDPWYHLGETYEGEAKEDFMLALKTIKWRASGGLRLKRGARDHVGPQNRDPPCHGFSLENILIIETTFHEPHVGLRLSKPKQKLNICKAKIKCFWTFLL